MVDAHPIADVFPRLSDEELGALSRDIAEHGLLEPIVLYEGLVLDGRNRLAACMLASVEPVFENYEGPNPIAFVVSRNLMRRHLTVGQIAIAGSEIATMRQGRPRNEKGAEPPLISLEEAASLLRTDVRRIKQAKRIEREAPELIAKIKSGEMALDRAERVVRDRAAARKRKEKVEKQVKSSTPKPDLRLGEFQEVLADLENVVDLILTDPPYGANALELWSDLGVFAQKALKPGGKLVAYSGQFHLPEIFHRLKLSLEYEWMGWLHTPGDHYTTFQRGVFSNGKPILFYSKPPINKTRRYSDSYTSPERTRDQHEWEQNAEPAYQLIESLTAPGDLVVDPFLGSGTFGLVAYSLGRRFVGAECDKEHFRTACAQMLDA